MGGGDAKIRLRVTNPLRRSRASELIGKSVPTHVYELPLGILIRIQEAGHQPYLGVLDFEIVAILKATTTTV